MQRQRPGHRILSFHHRGLLLLAAAVAVSLASPWPISSWLGSSFCPVFAAMALAMAWGLTPLVSVAQESSAPAPKVTQLKEVTVSSTRTERRVDNVPNTVSVVPQQQIEESGARSVKDMFSNEVDVSVRQAAARFTVASSGTGQINAIFPVPARS